MKPQVGDRVKSWMGHYGTVRTIRKKKGEKPVVVDMDHGAINYYHWDQLEVVSDHQEKRVTGS